MEEAIALFLSLTEEEKDRIISDMQELTNSKDCAIIAVA